MEIIVTILRGHTKPDICEKAILEGLTWNISGRCRILQFLLTLLHRIKLLGKTFLDGWLRFDSSHLNNKNLTLLGQLCTLFTI